jgi:hypothetical protein
VSHRRFPRVGVAAVGLAALIASCSSSKALEADTTADAGVNTTVAATVDTTVAATVDATVPTTVPTTVDATTVETSPAESTTSIVGSGRWVPAQIVQWQWLLGHPLVLDDPQDMGTARLTAGGDPAESPTVYDIDGFGNDAAIVAALHDRGAHVVCYIEVGGWEEYRSDSDQFPPAVIGKPVEGYPDERYLDIRSPDVLRIILTRIDMCAAKGFDAIEPDLDDTYTQDTGFDLTQQDSIEFNTALAAHAHELGLSIGLKNGDEPGFAEAMQPIVDFALVEQCFEFDSCDSFKSFIDAGKAVLEVEYNLSVNEFCERAQALLFSAVLHDQSLAGGGTPCR